MNPVLTSLPLAAFNALRLSAVSFAVLQLACASAQAQTATQPVGQLSPSGYWGAINTPTADVIPLGDAVLSLTNSNPERQRTQPAGSFGSLGAGIGVLPGLEGSMRLSYEGDLSCNMFDKVNCPAKQRDLSISGKYQLPLRLPMNTRIALGGTDYGGAATNYRQFFGVATTTLGLMDFSLGYSRAKSRAALMDGVFGSAAWRITDQLTALVENDTKEWRGGLQFRQQLSRDTSLQLAASRKLSNSSSGQQAWQMTAALQVALGGEPRSKRVQADQRAATLAALAALATTTATASAGDLALAIEAAGFAHVKVVRRAASGGEAALWQIQAEPRRWRKNQLDAMGALLGTWLKNQGAEGVDDALLTLTYQRQPVLNGFASAACVREWLQVSEWRCAADRTGLQGRGTMFLSASQELPEVLQAKLLAPASDVAEAGTERAWMPQAELSAQLATHVGTEFGIFDYTLAGEVGAEVALAPGLFWFGTFTVPLSHSKRYDDGEIFDNERLDTVGFDQAMLSYWKPLPHSMAVQASAGYLNRNHLGGQVDARWSSVDGRLRASALAGAYREEGTHTRRTPVLAALRYSVLPAQWQVEATAGQFLNGDRGVQLASVHWWGDTQMKLYYSNSQGDSGSSFSARRQMLGFAISFPLGPRDAQAVGPTWVRGADRWGWGLKTKVGEKDNALTRGYADIPALRHGLGSDVSDFDRNGSADLAVRARRVRETLVEGLATGQ
jgi:hypothetical protein